MTIPDGTFIQYRSLFRFLDKKGENSYRSFSKEDPELYKVKEHKSKEFQKT